MTGYSLNDIPNTYSMYNPQTKHVFISRDVKWDKWHTNNTSYDISEDIIHKKKN